MLFSAGGRTHSKSYARPEDCRDEHEDEKRPEGSAGSQTQAAHSQHAGGQHRLQCQSHF